MNSKPLPTSPRPLADAAKISPSSVYEAPRHVVRSHVLTDAQKADILEQWEADAIAMQTAADEGMTGGAPSRLDEVQKAQTELREITAGRGTVHQHSGSTKAEHLASTDNHNDNGGHRRGTVLTGNDARQGVTGNNVRYVLAISIVGVVVGFLLVARYLGTF